MDKNNRLRVDEEHNEIIINGNRLSKESTLNLLGVGLFMNLHALAVESGRISLEDIFVIALKPEEFEDWLMKTEEDGVTLMFSYHEPNDVYVISVASTPSKRDESTDDG